MNFSANPCMMVIKLVLQNNLWDEFKSRPMVITLCQTKLNNKGLCGGLDSFMFVLEVQLKA